MSEVESGMERTRQLDDAISVMRGDIEYAKNNNLRRTCSGCRFAIVWKADMLTMVLPNNFTLLMERIRFMLFFESNLFTSLEFSTIDLKLRSVSLIV